MGHSTSSGRNAAAAPQATETRTPETRATVTPERRAALSFNQRAQAIREMTFEEYGNGSRAVIPGVGTATVTQNETTGRYEGGFHLEREGVTQRVSGSSETLRQMETRVRIAMGNRNQRGNAGSR